MARTEAEYTDAMRAALPQGAAFPREGAPTRDALLSAIAAELALIDAETDRLLMEAAPDSTVALLPEWERDYGLPDCPDHAPATFQDRRAALVEKVRRVGGWNPKRIKALCAALGYAVEIIETRPFVGGLSRGGDVVGGPHACRHRVKVTVSGPRLTYFRGGRSAGGERQLAIARAEDLACMLRLIAPSHQQLVLSYQGAQ